MVRFIIIVLLAIGLSGGLLSCSSGGGGEEEADILEALEDDGSEAQADADFADEDFSDEDFADEDEAFADDEFSDDEESFADDEFTDDEFSEDELAADEFGEEGEEEAFQDVAEEELPVDDFGMAEDSFSEPVNIQAINFLSNQDGGTVEIQTDGEFSYETRLNEETNQFIIEVKNSVLKESLKRPYIMKEFGTAFAQINAYQAADSSVARIVIQLKELSEPVVQQEGSSLLILPTQQTTVADLDSTVDETAVEEPETEEQEAPINEIEVDTEKLVNTTFDTNEAAKDEKVLAARTLDEFLTDSSKFYGNPISIQVKDADIRDVINFIADESGVNLVMSEGVSGTITLKLRQVPWDQALVIVMRSKNLGYVRQGNVLRISPLTTLQAEASAANAILTEQKKLKPLKVKVIPVSYATPADLTAKITPFLTTGRGKIVSDDRTSSMIITDTEDILEKVGKLIKELDIPPAQVMIEGKVVEATEQFQRSAGINWNLSGSPVTISDDGGIGGSPVQFSPSLAIAPSASDSAGIGTLSLSVGTFDLIGDLNATLSLAESDSLVRVISSPRIVTMNREAASIQQTGEVINLQTTINGDTVQQTAVRNPVSLNLQVTPQITSEGSVIMEVDVQRQFAGPIVEQQTLSRAVNSRQATTKVLVRNGQTAVIGGIYQSDESESETGVPGLRKIPILGWLFKSRTTESQKNELLIFLTPRILNLKDLEVTDDLEESFDDEFEQEEEDVEDSDFASI